MEGKKTNHSLERVGGEVEILQNHKKTRQKNKKKKYEDKSKPLWKVESSCPTEIEEKEEGGGERTGSKKRKDDKEP